MAGASRVRILGLLAAAAAAMFVLVSLGNWQMQRLAWKTDLIETANNRLDAEPVRLPSETDDDRVISDYLYAPVTVSGRYAATQEVFVYTQLPKKRDGSGAPDLAAGAPGYWVFLPFELANGDIVFINRGFRGIDATDDIPAAPAGPVSLTGVLRARESGNLFTPEPTLERRIFYRRLPSEILTAYPELSRAREFYLDLAVPDTEGSLLTGRYDMSFTNNHLGYALTWYGLAVTLVLVAVPLVAGEIKRGRSSEGS